jgi:cyclophilin family peptidyl-prolyl cis-trans isomerase
MMRYTRRISVLFGLGLLISATFTACRPGTDSPAANIKSPDDKTAADGSSPLTKAQADPLHPMVLFETSLGNITLKLDAEKAQNTVLNFLGYVNEGHYNQTIIHQVYQNQGVLAGGYGADYAEKKATRMAVRNEANNGLKNLRKTVAMVRFPDDPDSATCQFFFNVTDNPALDYRDPTPDGFGYCVFGEVVDGMDVVDKMAAAQVHDTQDFERTPIKTIVIQTAKQIR